MVSALRNLGISWKILIFPLITALLAIGGSGFVLWALDNYRGAIQATVEVNFQKKATAEFCSDLWRALSMTARWPTQPSAKLRNERMAYSPDSHRIFSTSRMG
ncbi:hypothetical protein CCP2SC5_2430003 [Azospirillaceae bacterium]